MMKGRFLWIGLVLGVLLPATALGDGGFLPATAMERVRIPDQRALIHFANGTETLVIDTAFKGQGTHFAWIVPVPSAPSVEPATAGLFTTLQIIFQPRIVHDVFPLYRLVVLAGLVIAYVLWKLHRGESPIGGLFVVALLLIFTAGLLPALGGASATASGEVKVVDRKQVGVYDTATLKSRDGDAVFHWLKENGFAAPTNSVSAIRAYAREGWYFVASKLRLNAPLPEGAKAHPLALTFKTERPVYPLRLTALNADNCRIELYVFGPGRAEVPGFKVERCAAPSYPPPTAPPALRLEGLQIRHPLLRKLVARSPAATKLVARLDSQRMQQDAYIDWTPLKAKRLTRYSRHGAAVLAANISVPILMLGLLGLLVGGWAREEEPVPAKPTCGFSGTLVLAALVCGGSIYLWLPKVNVVVSHLPGLQMQSIQEREIPVALTWQSSQLGYGRNGKALPDAAWVRQQLAVTSDFRRSLVGWEQTNVITGNPWHEEDSPGNYTLRETPAGVDYVWYDIDGGEHVVPLFRKVEARKNSTSAGNRLGK